MRFLSFSVLAFTLSVSSAFPQGIPADTAAALANGWSLLAKGDAAGALRSASAELSRDDRNIGALALGVEASLASGGGSAGLAFYENWIRAHRVDPPYVLRRVALALLQDASRKGAGTPRFDALQALAADGDPDAMATLQSAAALNRIGETRALAAAGNTRAVDALIQQLQSTPGPKAPIIDALGASGSTRAVAALVPFLSDPQDVNRATAAEALGHIGATDAVPRIKPLLDDPVFLVKLKAAGALMRLNDARGLATLTEIAQSEYAHIRLAAATEMAAQPDAAWQELVRRLAADPDPTVRLEAARLIAPYDRGLAENVLRDLMQDSNIGIREAASGTFVAAVASDFASLRPLLHTADDTVKVKAAARILELTR